jgi:hypothetical protein
LRQVGMPAHDRPPERRDGPLRARLTLGSPDRPLAPRGAPEDV